jgi:hypothetical protein
VAENDYARTLIAERVQAASPSMGLSLSGRRASAPRWWHSWFPAGLTHPGTSRSADAGLASYTAGLVIAAAFMALSLGPGWVGFLVGFLPASLLTSWAVASHA